MDLLPPIAAVLVLATVLALCPGLMILLPDVLMRYGRDRVLGYRSLCSGPLALDQGATIVGRILLS